MVEALKKLSAPMDRGDLSLIAEAMLPDNAQSRFRLSLNWAQL